MSQTRFLISVQEALGLTFREALDCSLSQIEALMQEYSYVMVERNRRPDADGEVEGVDFEWIELPSFDDPTKTIRMKKYNDIADAKR